MNAYTELFIRHKMTLIMSLPHNDPELAYEAFIRGADAVKVHANVTHHASGNKFGNFDDNQVVFDEMLDAAKGPMGIMLGADSKDVALDTGKAAASKFSFISLYAHHVPACILRIPQARMVACDNTYSMKEIEYFNASGVNIVEASIVAAAEYGRTMNLRDLITYRRITQAAKIPVVVPTQLKIMPDEVPELFSAGIRGLMIGVIVSGSDKETIGAAVERYREAIDKL